jgi:hypothetical protein
MKRIMSGRRYDTEAKHTVEVASYSRGCASDFAHFREGLYRTNRGTWFLAGEGGPASCYATHHADGSRGSGERITPLTPGDALAWLERHDETDAIERYFGSEVTDA